MRTKNNYCAEWYSVYEVWICTRCFIILSRRGFYLFFIFATFSESPCPLHCLYLNLPICVLVPHFSLLVVILIMIPFISMSYFTQSSSVYPVYLLRFTRSSLLNYIAHLASGSIINSKDLQTTGP